MKTTLPWREEFEEILKIVVEDAKSYLGQVDRLPARPKMAHSFAKSLNDEFPKKGDGASSVLKELIYNCRHGAVNSAGPKCYHLVIGGSTPASFGADWITSVYDQIAYAWVSSPLAVQMEVISLKWLTQMFGIPANWKSVMTSGATMSNFVGLAAGRQWVGEQKGLDLADTGLAGFPPIKVFTSGHIHASTLKTLAMLGIGRSQAKKFVIDGVGNVDLEAMEEGLKSLNGEPGIIVATAGEPNAGAFDPIDKMADLAEKYNCWLHLDGAFGLFAKLSERTAHLVKGSERAHSITVDGHKWLNVPYDCGFSFVCDESLLIKAFRYTAEYLPSPDDPEPVMGAIGPESSRRARSFSVWSTLKAYGLEGYKALIEHHLDLAQHLKDRVVKEPLLELLAPVDLNIVCFRYIPDEFSENELNRVNKILGERIVEDGRVYLGTTTYDGKVALRPAISNWRTERHDLDHLLDVVLELGEQILRK